MVAYEATSLGCMFVVLTLVCSETLGVTYDGSVIDTRGSGICETINQTTLSPNGIWVGTGHMLHVCGWAQFRIKCSISILFVIASANFRTLIHTILLPYVHLIHSSLPNCEAR